MIRRGSELGHAFLSAIATTIGMDRTAHIDAATFNTMAAEGRREIYLAAGYWRAIATWSPNGTLIAVSLVNWERTAAECAAVERGIAILRHLDYQDGHVDAVMEGDTYE